MNLRGLHVHFDPSSGIAGDMAVAALVDAGVPAKVVSDAIAEMGVRGLTVGFEKRRRGAFVGRGFVVRGPGPHHGHHHGHHHEHRDYAEIRRLLQRARLEAETKRLAGTIFERVARAEAALHGVALDRVAFHEVGAWDSIADVVGAAAALAWLRPSSVSSTPPVLGSGQVHTAHGLMPVPAPATAAILRGVPALLEGEGELTTPTGAAILAALVGSFGPPPPMRIQAQGFGAGTREVSDRANVLRVLLGEALGRALPGSAPEVVLLEANLDDMSPQLIEPLMAALFAAGAVDVWTTSILMKKGRPAWQVSALVPPEGAELAERAFFRNSTTLGVRRAHMERAVLSRSLASVKTRFGTVSVKLAADGASVLGAAPEFDDCRRLADKAGVPVRTVLAEAAAAASRLLPSRERKRG
jgi:pyridinium-3,5-bisthiocarboxylic acid mononucleotide nickel chelatase